MGEVGKQSNDWLKLGSSSSSTGRLRCAQVKRYRPDKPADEVNTAQTVMEIFWRETRSEMR